MNRVPCLSSKLMQNPLVDEPFLISRLQLQNLNVDSPNPFLSIELELTQVAGDEQS